LLAGLVIGYLAATVFATWCGAQTGRGIPATFGDRGWDGGRVAGAPVG
jgi:hypothetical protein